MKTAIALSLLALSGIFSAPVLAANEHAGHTMGHSSAPASSKMAEGQVKKVDKSSGKVTIAHGPLENLGMPPMTMAFKVKDASWLNQMKDGDKIRFTADDVNGTLTIVQFERAK